MKRRNSYFLPCMADSLISLREKTVFLTVNANSEYSRIKIDRYDHDKTAFTIHHGLYRFVRMPFMLQNAMQTFQGVLDFMCASICCQLTFFYLNSVFFFSKWPIGHIGQTPRVLQLLYKARNTLELNKCKLFAETID